MRKTTTILFLLGLIAFTTTARYSQELKEGTLVDSMGSVNCEELQSRLDSFALEVAKEADAAGYAVVYPGRNPFTNAAYARGIRNNSAFRNFPAHLIQPIWGEGSRDLRIEMWKVPRGTSPPGREKSLNFVIPEIKLRIRFVEDDLEVAKHDGKLIYFSGGGNCVSEFNVEVLSKVLSANPRLSAEIRIFNRSRRNAQLLATLIRETARSKPKIRANRLRIIYGGSGIAKAWSSRVSAVEIWLKPSNLK